jgi:2-polyprenyl-6-methoxyphenol hydroxylase-like FAD-dependent oxidoreductase
MRHSCAEISDCRFTVAIGDLRCTLDPLTGQGANLASYGACVLTENIAESNGRFDKNFFQS